MFDSTISGRTLASVKRQNKDAQSTLIAFPRVGRSISSDEYLTAGNNNKEIKRSQPSNSYSQRNRAYWPIGEKRKIHTRSSKASMIAFPRVGKRNMPENNISNILKGQDVVAYQQDGELSGNKGIFINVGCVGGYLDVPA